MPHWIHFKLNGCPIGNFNTLRPRQNGRHFADDIFNCNFLNEMVWISIKISLKLVPGGSINNISALVQIMAWRRPGDKPLSKPMMVCLLTHICVTRPQWVKAKLSNVLQCQHIRCCSALHFDHYKFSIYKYSINCGIVTLCGVIELRQYWFS